MQGLTDRAIWAIAAEAAVYPLSFWFCWGDSGAPVPASCRLPAGAYHSHIALTPTISGVAMGVNVRCSNWRCVLSTARQAR